MLVQRAIVILALVLPAVLLSGCAGSRCEEWSTRTERIKVCGPRGTNCTVRDEPVQYCVRTSGERAAPRVVAPERIATAAPVPERPEPSEAPAAKKSGKADPTPAQAKARTRDKTGMPDLTSFWQALFSASRYPGLRYGKVNRVAMGPTTTPASSPQIEAALATHVRSVVSMQVASDEKFTPMDHRLDVVVYSARNREAAVALYKVMMRDEWRDKKLEAQPGVAFAVVKTDDKNSPEGRGQRIYLQRGSYVVEVDEWKSVYKDAKGRPLPGKQFPHTGPISPGVVAKAMIGTFPAE